ncbi:TMEM165/GDT1 family protein [Imhoffiella purpurea]|uniref:GDT1 family protein n=1 Tax=Imhoffiella purpurea TaxID=1249627 RepID=W9VE08_9GAMM|nr:TMEM165/GDT1 family protein [Imhoffiella purpurea]EXJ15231.1 hypothetical protein D779_1529 [Imhoffiella purpurea]
MPLFDSLSIPAWLVPAFTSFGLIFLAELGDKSQLVCITLAARHRQAPVLVGAVLAFVVLNTLAVVFGVGLAEWLPERLLAAIVAVLFAVFGVLALRSSLDCDDGEVPERPGHGILIATFLMILLAEMGDKTQIAVAGLASNLEPMAVWFGSTLALAATSALGVTIGCRMLSGVPMQRLHQLSGVIFLLLAAGALFKVF